MAFCTNCGAQIPDGSKFCTNCGTRMAEIPASPAPVPQAPIQSFVPPMPEPAAEPQEPVYAQPVQQPYAAPQEPVFTQPVQQPYAAPQEPVFTQPVQQPYAAPQDTVYTQPVQQPYAAPQDTGYAAPDQYAPYNPQQYAAPAPQYAAPQVGAANEPKKNKKSGGKPAVTIVIILAVIAALAVGGVLLLPKLFGGKEVEDDPNLGVYTATYAEMLGYEMEVDEIFDGEFTVELKAKGKCTIVVGSDKANGKWTLDGEDFSFSGGGIDCSGTLKDGAMELEDVLGMGVQLKLYKDGKVPAEATAPADNKSENANGGEEAKAGTTETTDNTDAALPEPQSEPQPAPAEPDPNLGKYIGYSLGFEGYLISIKEMEIENFDLELKDGGAITALSEGDSDDGTYTVNGETFRAEFDDDGEKVILEGTIKDGVITIPNFLDLSFELCLYKEGVTPVGELTSLSEALGITDPNAGLSDVQAYWNGDWYGWWVMTSTGGDYADMEGYWWDLCAYIEVNPDGTATITLWDEDCAEDEAMACVDLSILPDGTSEHGTAMSESGWFYEMDIAHADWIIDPGLSAYDQMIWIDGHYEDADCSFDYDMYLRPWGVRWDDTAEEERPYYYDDWYLPLIDAGEPMPLSIDVE